MTIRFFTEEDVPAAAELEQLCFPDPWSQKGLRDTLREEGSCFLAAEDKNGALCGYLNATWVLDECNLNRICVHPDFRKHPGFRKQTGLPAYLPEIRTSYWNTGCRS